MRSAIEMIGISCSKAICCKTVMPAIEPSLGSITVERTDTGRKPANVTRSTDASVCPALFNTPPFRYLRGNMCPGLLRSLGLESGEARVRIVFALSAAETPVDMPTLASTVTVEAAAEISSISVIGDIIGIINLSMSSSFIPTEMIPEPFLIMNAIDSGFTRVAAMTRSPS
uniref:Riboflavin biosynthesis protein ribAB n=1 Tax=Arundo donax TaxID=35708 RepID=A0A0A9G1I1_ARUDO